VSMFTRLHHVSAERDLWCMLLRAGRCGEDVSSKTLRFQLRDDRVNGVFRKDNNEI